MTKKSKLDKRLRENEPRFRKMMEYIDGAQHDVYTSALKAGFSKTQAVRYSRDEKIVARASAVFEKFARTAQMEALGTMYRTMQTTTSSAEKLRAADMIAKHTGLKDIIVPKDSGGDVNKLDIAQLKALSGQLGLLIQQGEQSAKVIEGIASPIETEDELLL